MSKRVMLKDLCLKITDGSHYSPEGIEEGIPMLSVKDMRDNGFDYSNCKKISKEDYQVLNSNGCHPELNDILIAKDGSYLKHIFVVEKECEQAVLSSIGILKTNVQKVNPYYIKYYLSSDFVKKEVAKKYVSGSALPRIILKNFSQIEIPYIDREAQDRIVNVLKNIDNKIDNNNKINSELESMAKTIYDYWFLQFEFPNEYGKPYKSSGGKMVWNEELKREIPEGWEIKKVSEILSTIRQNKKINSSEYLEKGKYPIIDQSSEYICGFTNDEDALINFDDAIVFGDHTKILKYINFTFARGADGTQIINSNNEKLSNYLLYQQLHDVKLVSQGYSRYFKFLKEVKVVIPSKYIGEKYSDYINSLLKMRRNNIFENLHLTKLRDFLLPLLMNGQVGFKEDIGDEIRSKDIEEKELISK